MFKIYIGNGDPIILAISIRYFTHVGIIYHGQNLKHNSEKIRLYPHPIYILNYYKKIV